MIWIYHIHMNMTMYVFTPRIAPHCDPLQHKHNFCWDPWNWCYWLIYIWIQPWVPRDTTHLYFFLGPVTQLLEFSESIHIYVQLILLCSIRSGHMTHSYMNEKIIIDFYIAMYTCIYVIIYVYTYVCIHTYIHVHI